jgi:xylulokinase
MDIGDVCGANLWDMNGGKWDEDLLSLAAGSHDGVAELKKKLGDVDEDGGISFGTISKYFVSKYGFAPGCKVIAATGDNPSTILSLPLRESDAMVSLGTSTTFLMSTPRFLPSPSYHFMNHPTTAGLYMFMLCYKNGGLAREKIRDALNSNDSGSWDKFNEIATSSSPLNQKRSSDPMKLGLFFPLPEIVPNVPAGTWRFLYDPPADKLRPTTQPSKEWPGPEIDARAIVESQFLSLRLRSQNLVSPQKDSKTGVELPAQPRRIYLVGGGSQNAAIAEICADVLGSVEGVYKLDIGGNACALGAAYKAVWGCERESGETFEELIGSRWDEEKFVQKICEGYRKGTWEKYGDSLKGFDEMEKRVLKEVSTSGGDVKINSRPEGSGE